jgi:hypothetical protein
VVRRPDAAEGDLARWTAMIFIPTSSVAPRFCPTCGLEWVRCGVGAGEDGTPEVRLLCKNWHEFPWSVSLHEAALFLVTNHPDELLSNPMWLVGERRRLPSGGESRRWLDPGRRFSLRGERYDVVAIETERTWIRRSPSSAPVSGAEPDRSPGRH